MKQALSILCMVVTTWAVCVAQQTTNAPAVKSSASPAGTNTSYTALMPEEAAKEIFKPPTSKAPSTITPTLYDGMQTPPLSATAQKHQYLGFRLGMAVEEATLLAQTSGKTLSELEKGKKYSMEGCLTEVPRPEKAKTILIFKADKLDLIQIFWDDNNTLFVNLEPSMIETYGKPLKVDELFRRYWVLENNDCIRMLFDVAAHQTSLVYGSKESVFGLSEEEKLQIRKKKWGL